ncbi:hypothetical protein [Pseudophaeobacter sp.]|uniref:hypothetical protein n=1 Tax=Pseudophaeobacter sp. TaxID=1971739 RepID=UPI0032990D54
MTQTHHRPRRAGADSQPRPDHHVSQSICMHLGSPCPSLARMLEALSGALDKARDVTEADFQICGESRLDGCDRHCPAQYVASHDRIRVFCDVSKEADTEALNLFADALFSPVSSGIAAAVIAQRPCAIGEVRSLLPRQKADPKDAAPLVDAL